MRDQDRVELLDTVSATFLQVVEQLTFMFGEPTDKSVILDDDVEHVVASLAFTGDVNGTLSLVAPADCVREIAANILGLEPDELDPDSLAPDSLGEMLNVICGHVIMAIAGRNADFRLGSPVIAAAGPDFLVTAVASAEWLGFVLDDSPVLLGLVTE